MRGRSRAVKHDLDFRTSNQRLSSTRRAAMDRVRLVLSVAIGLLAMASKARQASAQNATGPDGAQVAAADLAITEPALRGHIRFLADDLLEGRGPGSRGDE